MKINELNDKEKKSDSIGNTRSKFRVNEYITLKLENSLTDLYLNRQKFIQCKRLVINIREKDIEKYDEINCIDEAADIHNTFLFKNTPVIGKDAKPINDFPYRITPEEEFWGHCSNIQAWCENNYDTRLLHSNLAFPLLKKLVEVGDNKAKRVFKEEIAKRFCCRSINVKNFLIHEGYLNYFNNEELNFLLDDFKDFINNIHDMDEKMKEIVIFYTLGLIFLDRNHYETFFQKLWKIMYDKNDINYVKNLIALNRKLHGISDIGDSYLVSKLSEFIDNIENPSNNLGNLLLEECQYKEAIIIFEKLLEQDKSNYSALKSLAKAYYRDKLYKKSIKLYKRALKYKKKDIYLLVRFAEVYNTLSEYGKSIKLHKKALKINPNNVELMILLGNSFEELGKYSQAIEIYRKALKINSEFNFELWNLLGSLFEELGRSEKALSCFIESYKIKPEYIINLLDIIRISLKLNYKDLAIVISRFTLSFSPVLDLPLKVYGDYLIEEQDFQTAIGLYEKAIKKCPYAFKNWLILGILYLKNGMEKEAFETFESVKKFNPRDPKIYITLSNLIDLTKLNVLAKKYYDFSEEMLVDNLELIEEIRLEISK